jgi:hypothetical protein
VSFQRSSIQFKVGEVGLNVSRTSVEDVERNEHARYTQKAVLDVPGGTLARGLTAIRAERLAVKVLN